MKVSSVNVSIKGISALLMHAYPMVAVEHQEKMTIEDQAELGAYRIPNDSKELYVPALAIQRALVAAAAFSKGKGRASLQKQVAACVIVSPEYLGLGTSTYTIDSRPVVIAATKGRIVRHRPRIDNWALDFKIEYDPHLLSEKELRTIVDDMGSRVGLLDFRPACKGPFGRSMVVKWESE